jgi:threonyl-tRNA synthetase
MTAANAAREEARAAGPEEKKKPAPTPAPKPAAEPKPEGETAAEKKPGPGEVEPQNPPPGYARPVIIHRAILGSFERFIGILTEHFAGKWPFWLSPRQILVVPVTASAEPYVREVQKILKGEKFYVDSDLGAHTMNKKIRNGQLMQYNFILGV